MSRGRGLGKEGVGGATGRGEKQGESMDAVGLQVGMAGERDFFPSRVPPFSLSLGSIFCASILVFLRVFFFSKFFVKRVNVVKREWCRYIFFLPHQLTKKKRKA